MPSTTLNFDETEHNNLLFDEHQLSYMLESDTKESPTFLNISKLQNPFSYQLNIVKDMQTQNTDYRFTGNFQLPARFISPDSPVSVRR